MSNRIILQIGISGLFFVLMLVALRALVQGPIQELSQAVESLQQGQEAIRREMGEIKTLVNASAKPSSAAAKTKASVRPINNIAFNLGANPIQGAATAKLTLIEFTDYQ